MPKLVLSVWKLRRYVGSSQSPPEGGVDKAAPAIPGGNLLLPALGDVNLSRANPDGMGLEPAVEPGKVGLAPNSPGFLLGVNLLQGSGFDGLHKLRIGLSYPFWD